jgi:hypothetical protein
VHWTGGRSTGSTPTATAKTKTTTPTDLQVASLFSWICGAASRVAHKGYDFNSMRVRIVATGKIGQPTAETLPLSPVASSRPLPATLMTLPIGCDTTESEFLAHFMVLS